MPFLPGSTHGAEPGFQKRKWLSGSKLSDSIASVHSSESDLEVMLIASARPCGSVDQDVRMVDDFPVAGQKLDSFDVSRLRAGRGMTKLRKRSVVPAGRCRSRHFDNQVGPA